MLYSLLKTLHLLAIVAWVGGMAFMTLCLRPAVATLAPSVRLPLLRSVLGRFFNVVLVASVLSLVTGFSMAGRAARQGVQAGGSFTMPLSWTVMAVLGVVMLAIFGHIRFALFKRLSRAVDAEDWPAGGAAMAGLRPWVLINLLIGLIVIAVAVIGGAR